MEEIVKAISWQYLAFLFALISIFVFRQPLSGLIKRTIKIDKEGLTAEPSPESQRERTETSAEAVQQLLDVVGNSIVINEIEERIRNELTTKGLPVEEDTAKVLIKHLSGTQLLLEFERIHSSIFGSQIFLLKKLNEVAGQGRTEEFVKNYIEHVKELYAEQLGEWTSEQYLSFLYSQLLIVSDSWQIHITNLGVEYLTWITRNGRREDNAL